MSQNFTLLSTKFMIILVLMYITTGIPFHWTVPHIIIISLFITGTTYILSDLVILPAGGNPAATATDFVLVMIGSWAVGTIVSTGGSIPLLQGPVYAAFAISASEGMILHPLLRKHHLKESGNKSTA
ncbi:MAG TPA: DUF2512 family protein [Bacillales bacterium]|nr:DUF2512 family protein [Bacillales bacterium]